MHVEFCYTESSWFGFLVAELRVAFEELHEHTAMNVKQEVIDGEEERERDMHAAVPLDHRSLTVVLMSAEL